jgi:hypothetical protein
MNDVFPSLISPTTDFGAVRARRRAGPLHYDVDLSTARSLVAGTALVLPIAGNSLYVDQKASTGAAQVHFVDDTFSLGNTGITVFAGFIARVPFTQLVIQNSAQPGQTIRIVYGVDLDFVPGAGAGVTVTNALNVNDQISDACRVDVIALPTAIGVNQVTQLLAPAANPRGTLIRHINESISAGAGGTIASFTVAATSAPAAIASIANAVQLMQSTSSSTTATERDVPIMNRRIPATWGVWNVTNVTVVVAGVHTFYWSYEIQ